MGLKDAKYKIINNGENGIILVGCFKEDLNVVIIVHFTKLRTVSNSAGVKSPPELRYLTSISYSQQALPKPFPFLHFLFQPFSPPLSM